MCHFVSNLHISDQSGRFHLFSPSPRWVTHSRTRHSQPHGPTCLEIFFFSFFKTIILYMFNTKAENLLENYTQGALPGQRAGNEGSWLWLLFSVFAPQPRRLYNVQMPNPQIPRRNPHTSTPLKICSSLTLGKSLNTSLPGFTQLQNENNHIC